MAWPLFSAQQVIAFASLQSASRLNLSQVQPMSASWRRVNRLLWLCLQHQQLTCSSSVARRLRQQSWTGSRGINLMINPLCRFCLPRSALDTIKNALSILARAQHPLFSRSSNHLQDLHNLRLLRQRPRILLAPFVMQRVLRQQIHLVLSHTDILQ